MRLGDHDFSADPRDLEGGSVVWTAGAAAIGCPARAFRRAEELEAAASLQSALAAAAADGGRWCPAASGTVEDSGREVVYVVSTLPAGARSLAAVLESEAASTDDARLARLAWSLALGTLRALLDLHERGIHHGELSPESAIRDRIVVVQRPDGAVDVSLQFPSPRLARLLQEQRQADVASPDQTDTARIAHVLRAVLHRRDALDPDTSIDEMLLSRLFGDGHAAWMRFFSEATAGKLHGDPDFIRSRIALLEPAKPSVSGAAHDLKFKARRLASNPAVLWGGIAGVVTVVAAITLAVSWRTIFPKPKLAVVLASTAAPQEGNPIDIEIKADGAGDLTELLPTGDLTGRCYKLVDGAAKSETEPFKTVVFKDQGGSWRARLPMSDRPYIVRFEDEFEGTGAPIKVAATDAPPTYKVVKESLQSDDAGEVRLKIIGTDADSEPAQPTVLVEGQPLDAKSITVDSSGSAKGEWTWTATLRRELATEEQSLGVTVASKDAGRIIIRDIPFTLEVPATSGENETVTLALKPKEGRTPSGMDKVKASVKFSKRSLEAKEVPFDARGQATLKLPESDGRYLATVSALVQNKEIQNKSIDVDANDDLPQYRLQVTPRAAAEGAPTNVAVDITFTATDPDTDLSAMEPPELFERAAQKAAARDRAPIKIEGVQWAKDAKSTANNWVWKGTAQVAKSKEQRDSTIVARVDGSEVVQDGKPILVAALPVEPKPKEPVTQPNKPTPTQNQTATPPNTPPNTTTATKTPDTKTPDTKTPDTKTPDTKTPDTKTPDTKTPDTTTATTTPKETPPPPPPPPPPPEPLRVSALLQGPNEVEEGKSFAVSVRAENLEKAGGKQAGPESLRWRLDDAPPKLQDNLNRQLETLNRNPTGGEITAPEYNERYTIALSVASLDPQVKVVPTSQSVRVVVKAVNNPSVTEQTVVRDAKGNTIAAGSATPGAKTKSVTIEVTRSDRDSDPTPPTVTKDGAEMPLARRSAPQQSSGPARADREMVVFTTEFPITAQTTIKVDNATYSVFWDPTEPEEEVVAQYGLSRRDDGSWLSAPIGRDRGKFAVAETDTETLKREDLAQLLGELKAAGLNARLVTEDEWRNAVRSRPSSGTVLFELLGKENYQDGRSTKSRQSWLKIFREANLLQEQAPVEAAVDALATFVGDAASPSLIGIPPGQQFPRLSGDGKYKGQLEKWLGNLLKDGKGEWDPKPLPAELGVTTGYTRIVIEPKKTAQP